MILHTDSIVYTNVIREKRQKRVRLPIDQSDDLLDLTKPEMETFFYEIEISRNIQFRGREGKFQFGKSLP